MNTNSANNPCTTPESKTVRPHGEPKGIHLESRSDFRQQRHTRFADDEIGGDTGDGRHMP